MMRADIHTLRTFYAGPLGQIAARMIDRRLSALWPEAAGLDVLGLGFTHPFLDRFRPRARRVLSFQPVDQGGEAWPATGPGLAVIGDDQRLPFLDNLFDRVILCHALEEADNPQHLLREVWRIMAPEGRLIIIAANRRGLWAGSEGTPFGQGRAFSQSQLEVLLGDSLLQPIAWARALYGLPLSWGPLVLTADAFEIAGERFWPPFGGVLMVEAIKRLYAGSDGVRRGVLLARPVAAR